MPTIVMMTATKHAWVGICLLFSASSTLAKDKIHTPKPIMSIRMASQEQVDGLQAKCMTTDPKGRLVSEFKCHFSSIVIAKSTPFSMDISDALRKNYSSPKAFNELVQKCSKSLQTEREEISKWTGSPAKRSYRERNFSKMQRMCSCKNINCYVELNKQLDHTDQNECEIWGSTFDAVLKRESENRWISEPERSLSGEISSIFMMEYDEKSDDWDFIQQRVCLNLSDKYCVAAARPYRASTRNTSEWALLNCEVIGPISPD